MAHPYLIQAPVVVNDCSSLTNWAASQGTRSLAARPDTAYGSTPKLLLTSAVATASVMDLTLAATLSGRLQFLLYVEPFDNAHGDNQNSLNGAFYAANDSGFAAFFVRTQVLNPGFNRVQFTRATTAIGGNKDNSWTIGAGAPSWASNMVRLRFNFGAKTGIATRVWLHNITQTAYYRPKCLIMFDDGLSSVYTDAFPILTALGFVATLYVIKDKVGTAGYMTAAQITEIYNAGWAICNHTTTHETGLRNQTVAYCKAVITGGSDYIKAQGWNRLDSAHHFAAPFGESTYTQAKNYRQGIQDAGTLSTRITIERCNAPFITDPLNISCYGPDGTTETAADINNRITSCIGSGGVMALLFHDIVTPASTAIKWTPTNFTANMRELYRRRAEIDVITVPQFYKDVKASSALTD